MELLLSLFGVCSAVALGAMSPGPSFLYVARTAVAVSRRDGLAAALGMGVGATLLAVLVLLGLQSLFAAFPWVFGALKIAGGLYLCWLAVGAWRGARSALPDAESAAAVDRPGVARSFWRAVFTQVSNPKAIVVYGGIFAALLPPEMPRSGFLLLPLLVFAIETAWYAVVAVVLSAPVPRRWYLRGKPVLDRIAGAVLGLLGVKLVVSSA